MSSTLSEDQRRQQTRQRRSTRTRITGSDLTGASAVWRIVRISISYRWHLAAAIVLAIVSSVLQVLIPRLLGEGVDQAFTLIQEGGQNQDQIRSLLWDTALLVVLVSFFRGTTGFATMFLGETLAQRVSTRLRMIFFDKLQALSFSFHDNVHTGQLMSRGLSDIEGVRMFVQMGMVQIFRVAFMLIAAGVFMAILDWQLALLSLSFIPFMVFRSTQLRLSLRVFWRQIQDVLGELSTSMQENLAGVRVVRAFSAQRYEEQKFDKIAREFVDLRMKAERAHARGSGFISFSFIMAWAIVLWFGGSKVIDGNMTIGELAQFFTFLALLRFPVRMATQIVNSTARAASAGGRIFEILDVPPSIEDSPGAKPLEITDSVVKFEDVSFKYDDNPALENISFEASPDHTVGIVGPPGSGKTSVVHLLPRFYDPTSGSVTVDGVDIRDASVNSVRRSVGIVEQDPFLFNGSIRDNIRYGENDASDERVIEAAKMAQIHDFIVSLPEGYESMIGERGVGLSGGQRQRVAIARTLLPNPAVLIFDDSTSSVDAGTDARIRAELLKVAEGRTTIIVAHRMSSLAHADEILVLDNGRIVERGGHKELMALDGHYANLFDLQQTQSSEIDE